MKSGFICVASILIAALSTYRYYSLLNELEQTHAPIAQFLAREIEGVPVHRHIKTDALAVFKVEDAFLVCGYASQALSSAPERARK